MVLQEILDELIVQFPLHIYWKCVSQGRKGETTLYIALQRILNGSHWSALLFYLKLLADLERMGFGLNPYKLCVANKDMIGSHMTLMLLVDDIKISHKDSNEVDLIIKWFWVVHGANA